MSNILLAAVVVAADVVAVAVAAVVAVFAVVAAAAVFPLKKIPNLFPASFSSLSSRIMSDRYGPEFFVDFFISLLLVGSSFDVVDDNDGNDVDVDDDS